VLRDRPAPPDLDLLVGKGKGGHFTTWLALHQQDAERAREAARPFGWSPPWQLRITDNALPLTCLVTGTTLGQLNAAVLEAVKEQIASSVMLTRIGRVHLTAQLQGLRALAYQLRLIDDAPVHPNTRTVSPAQRAAAITQPELRRAVGRYLTVIATTVRPKTVEGRAASLRTFCDWLAEQHPQVTSLRQLTRAQLEQFLAFDAHRPGRGKTGRDHISVGHHARTVVDLRAFFDDLAAWDWAEGPRRVLLHRTDIPRLQKPLPRALAPDIDAALMAAVDELQDTAARCAIVLLRGTGLRIGEVLDLELSCLWDLPGHGTWLKVPLGKLNTERVVPLDEHTLAALDAWMSCRGSQRALPHPRQGRSTDFLFTIRGARVGASRVRRGLQAATAGAGLTGTNGQPLSITPHQLRHTYATSLVNAGMSLQALMALLGHVSPQMTLRYAALASPTVKLAYDTAMDRVRGQRQLPLVVADRPVIPDRIEWLRSEMLKTRVAHGYCSRHLAAEACAYANICEQCDNYTTTSEFGPQLQAQLADATALREDAEARGWDSEVARHARVISSLQGHLDRLKQDDTSGPKV